jgi:monoamine oxidase
MPRRRRRRYGVVRASTQGVPQIMSKVVIVGGGCAGLAAAKTLLERGGVRVVLLEAKNRLGGRAWTADTPGLPLDMGPQFVQDPKSNPWTPILLAEQPPVQAPYPAIATRYRVRQEDGWVTLEDDDVEGLATVNNLISRCYQDGAESDNLPAVPHDYTPPDNVSDAVIALGFGSSGYGSLGESAEPWNYVARDAERQGGDVREEDLDPNNQHDRNRYVTGGIGAMVARFGAKLQQDYQDTLEIRLNSVVNTIRTGERVELLVDGDDPIDADYCIVTVPVGVVEQISFDPPLPPGRREATDYLKLGSYKKVAFKPASLPDAGGETIDTNTEYYIYDSEEGKCWQYFRLPTQDEMLICVASGDFAAELDTRTKRAVFDSVTALLGTAHPSGDFSVEDDAFVVTNWSCEPYIRGAYSYTHYDGSAPDNPVPLQGRIRAAERHGRVHFAGEATWVDAYGTIAGAYRSGERAANEVLARAAQD